MKKLIVSHKIQLIQETIIYVSCAFLMLCTISCKDDTIAESRQEIVVEGWIDDGGFPVVLLTKNVPISSEYQSIDSLSNYLIKWAKVTVSDGENQVTLTGKFDKHYTPGYIYTTSRLRGKAGKRYTLSVDDGDFHASAETTIPQPISVDSFQVRKCADSDTLYQINAFFTDPPSEHNYYKVLTCRMNKDKEFYSAFLGTVDDNNTDTLKSIAVHRSNGILKEKEYTPYFSVNDTVIVKFATIDSVSYLFWRDFDKVLSLSRTSFFHIYNNIHTNITGGLGYWCGYGAKYDVIDIKNRKRVTK